MQIDNASGQGYCAEHTATNGHNLLESLGWHYSHTTSIHRADGSVYFYHTYKCELADFSIGTSHCSGVFSCHRGGSGHSHTVHGLLALKKYLVEKNTAIRREVTRASYGMDKTGKFI